MSARKISKLSFSAFREIALFNIYYYDGMLISKPNVQHQFFFDKAEAEHFENHIHLDIYLKCEELEKEDFIDIAQLLFNRIKGMYPDVRFIVYLVYDSDNMPFLDFGAIREGELLYFDLNSEKVEYYINEPCRQ